MPLIKTTKKDLVKRKRSADFTQELLLNEHRQGQGESQSSVELRKQDSTQQKRNQSIAHKKADNDDEESKKQVEEAEFKPEEGYKWDFCIVVPNPYYSKDSNAQKLDDEEEAKKNKAGCCGCLGGGKKDEEEEVELGKPTVPYHEIAERLAMAGLQSYRYRSGDGDEIFIKVRAPLSVLQDRADSIGMDLLYDYNRLRNVVDSRDHPIHDDQDITKIPPYQFIYGSYIKANDDLFARAEGYKHPFSSIIRLKLIMGLITSNDSECANLNLRRLRNDGNGKLQNSVLAYYPLHDDHARDELTRTWLNWKNQPWDQPLDDVKEYLGEKVALYFEFTAHYTTWLVSLSIVSVIVILDLMVESAMTTVQDALIGAYSLPFYCIYVAFWSQFMIEYWKRREVTKSMEWGMGNFEEEELERPEFHGEQIKSFVDGKDMTYFSPKKKFAANMRSAYSVGSMILLVLVCVSFIFFAQYMINTSLPEGMLKSLGNTVVSLASAVQIIVLNSMYSEKAIKLTDQENHRTDTEYDDALIGKLFAFSFINSYAALFFIAYVKTVISVCQGGACMVELSYQLTVIFASKLTIDKITTYVTLVMNRRLKEREEEEHYRAAKERGLDVKHASKAELEYRLEEYDPSLGVLEDYGQIFIQFGYVTLFVAACPLAPILAYFSNFIEIRSDGYKLLYFMRRVIPTGCEDIGTWLVILQTTAYISVATNAALLCFTMALLNYTPVARVWTFILFQYFVGTLMALFEWLIEDIPEEVRIQLDRQKYLVERAEMSPEERANDGKLDVNRPKLVDMTEAFLKPKEDDDDALPLLHSKKA